MRPGWDAERVDVRRVAASAAAVVVLALAVAPPALSGQSHDEPRRQASFTAGASFGDGNTAPALAAGLGFWFSPRVGVDVELAYARKLDFVLDLCPAPRVCVIGGQLPVTGRTVSLVPHLSVQLLPVSGRLRAYVQAGAGGGHVRQRYKLGPPLGTNITERTRSSTTLAVSFGGGASVLISRQITLSADVRSLHVLDEAAEPGLFITPSDTLSTLRIGSRVGWRF